jgi:hypothetical protein
MFLNIIHHVVDISYTRQIVQLIESHKNQKKILQKNCESFYIYPQKLTNNHLQLTET